MNVWTMIWLGVLIAFLIMEAVTIKLISIWFAAGALVAMLIAILGGPLWLQILAFFTVAIVLFAMLWPVAKKHLNPKIVPTNTDALVGKICTVTQTIDPQEGGRVKVGDVTWSARTEEGAQISAGARVRILEIRGAKVYVETVKKEVEV